MKTAIIDLYDISNQYVVKRIIEKQKYTILGVIPFTYCSDRSKLELDESLPIYSTNDHITDQYEFCIILNNKNIQREAAYRLVENYLKKGKSIECFYLFSIEEIEDLSLIAKENNAIFYPARADIEVKSKTIDAINIPVVYVSGLHEQCDIFTNHSALDSALIKQGYKTINITNSQYAHIFDYILTYSLFNPFEFNSSIDIANIKEQVVEIIHQTNADILIVSNINNFVNFKNFNVNFGFDNYVLNNVFDFDYVIYNIPTNMLISDSKKSMELLTKAISEKTNNAEVILGVSHAMLDKYFNNNYYFIRVQEDEYNYCYNQYKCLFENIVDSSSINDITRYFSKF